MQGHICQTDAFLWVPDVSQVGGKWIGTRTSSWIVPCLVLVWWMSRSPQILSTGHASVHLSVLRLELSDCVYECVIPGRMHLSDSIYTCVSWSGWIQSLSWENSRWKQGGNAAWMWRQSIVGHDSSFEMSSVNHVKMSFYFFLERHFVYVAQHIKLLIPHSRVRNPTTSMVLEVVNWRKPTRTQGEHE